MGVEPVLSNTGARRTLRKLELEAYAAVVSAFRAQGSLTNDKKSSLDYLSKILGISPERHRAEIRRAVNDELLASVAGCLTGYETDKAWRKEGQKLATTNPRFVSRPASHIPQVLTVATLTAAMGQKGGAPALKTTPTPGNITDNIDFKKVSLQLQNALKLVMSQNPSLPPTTSRASSLSQESKALNSLRPQSAPVTPVKASASPSVATTSPSKSIPSSTQPPLNAGTVTCKLTGTKVVASVHRKPVTTSASPTVRVVASTNSLPVKSVKSERLSTTDAPSPKKSKLSAIESLLCEETISPRNSPGPAKTQAKDEIEKHGSPKPVEKAEKTPSQTEKKEIVESSSKKVELVTPSKSTDHKEDKVESISKEVTTTTKEEIKSEPSDKPAPPSNVSNVATSEEKKDAKSNDLTSGSEMDTTPCPEQSTSVSAPSSKEPTSTGAAEEALSSVDNVPVKEVKLPLKEDTVKVMKPSSHGPPPPLLPLPPPLLPVSLPSQQSPPSPPSSQASPSPSSLSTITSIQSENKEKKPVVDEAKGKKEEKAEPCTSEMTKPSPPAPTHITSPHPPAQQKEEDSVLQRLARKRSPSPLTVETPPPAKKLAIAPKEEKDIDTTPSLAIPSSSSSKTATTAVTQTSTTPTVTVVTLASSSMMTDSPTDLPPSSSTPKIDISSPSPLTNEVNADSLIQSLCSNSNSFEEDPDVTVLASQLGLESLDSPVFNLSGFLSLIQPDLSVLKPEEELPSAGGGKEEQSMGETGRTDLNASIKTTLEVSGEDASSKSQTLAKPEQPLSSPLVSKTSALNIQTSSVMSLTLDTPLSVAGTTTARVLSTSLPPSAPKLATCIDTAPPLSLPLPPESDPLSPIPPTKAMFPEDPVPSRPLFLGISTLPSVDQSPSSLTNTPATPPPPLTPTPLTPLGEGLLDLSDIQSLMDESEVMEGISQDVVESISKLVDLDEQSTNATWK